ncbi:MAG TPA: four helix bundle protein, partial [Phycisphaerales bacterium]|nr:four helix bundle protein [Phycisphaerales bacterium]
KLSDAETEAAETQEWVSFSVECGYMKRDKGVELFKEYEAVLKTIVGMINNAERWLIVEKK